MIEILNSEMKSNIWHHPFMIFFSMQFFSLVISCHLYIKFILMLDSHISET